MNGRRVKPILLRAEESELTFRNYLIYEPGRIWNGKSDNTEPKHLYILDDKATIRKGDWYAIYNNDAYQLFVATDKESIDWLMRKPRGYYRVAATTDPKLIEDGVPTISSDFVKKFVEVDGKCVVDIKIDMEWCKSTGKYHEYYDNPNWMLPLLDDDGNAILSITPEPVCGTYNVSDQKRRVVELKRTGIMGDISEEEYDRIMSEPSLGLFEEANMRERQEEGAMETAATKYSKKLQLPEHQKVSEQAFEAGWKAAMAYKRTQR